MKVLQQFVFRLSSKRKYPHHRWLKTCFECFDNLIFRLIRQEIEKQISKDTFCNLGFYGINWKLEITLTELPENDDDKTPTKTIDLTYDK